MKTLTNYTSSNSSLKVGVRKMKRHAIDWKKIISKHISDKGAISGIYINTFTTQEADKTRQFKKYEKDLNSSPNKIHRWQITP